MVTHDRYFLERVANHITEVSRGKLYHYEANYSKYLELKEQRQEMERSSERKRQSILRTEREWIMRGCRARTTKSKDRIQRYEELRDRSAPEADSSVQMASASARLGRKIIELSHVSKAFDGRTLFSDIYLRVEDGERIVLIGENGTGKTTLLNMLLGLEPTDSGVFKLGPSVKAAYLPQIIHFNHPERSILDTMLYEKKDMTAQSARNRLAAYQFQGEDVFKPVSVLSGGELSRLRLCMLMDEEINLLILDEPTNHLDIAAREWIEEAVEAFDGTLLFVSHDRYFIQRFATRIWELADGTITDYPMGFAQYRAVKAQEKAPQPVKAPEKKGDTRPPRGNRSQQAARRQLTICETGISKLEAECRRLDEEMAAHACDAGELNRLYQEKQEVEARLEQEMARWEELSLQIEE